MNGMDGFYGSPYGSMNLGRSINQMGTDATMTDVGDHAMEDEAMGDSLDDIINQNQEMQRRQTMDVHFSMGTGFAPQNRRSSMLEFGGADENGLSEFGFDPAPSQSNFAPNQDQANIQKVSHLRKARSIDNVNLNNTFSPYESVFNSIPQTSSYTTPIHTSASTTMSMPNSTFIPTSDISMDFNDPAGTMPPMNFPILPQQQMFTQSPMYSKFPSSYAPPKPDMATTDGSMDEQAMMEKVAQMSIPGRSNDQEASAEPMRQSSGMNSGGHTPVIHKSNSMSVGTPQSLNVATPQNINSDHVQEASTPYSNGVTIPEGLVQMQRDAPLPSQYPNAYSASGFDMLGVLMRVAQRKRPEINIGPVDMSCAFVVCDITRHDMPIAYCSEVFERLTGYSKHEILGRNCRFLQAPDGRVQAGVKRKYVDDKSVLHLKNKISKREEVQLSLINYRKGGQPFMNLLTMIPVLWDNDEYRYYVGFQVDLVEQPGSVSGRNPDGSYAINYSRGLNLPRYIAQPPTEDRGSQMENGQSIGRDEVSTVLSTIANGESELSKRIWDKVLLENTDDVIHVLSLKGLFLYLSPACRKVLEYEAQELVGTALSSVCHPSDIVPVTRELKDTSSGSPINVVFRIRRKHSGYTWFESHGTLHTEQGKGRKCIILVGRERPVYALTRPGIEIGDSEVWSKISTSGMVLFVASNVRLLLDRTPDDLIGTSKSRKEIILQT
ncbi:putative white collar [Phaeomoniella chlamydospora]|uniref:Putative white collar n=1 Tax=Phaeomoniella chlamydospora TaxID=158046 RepID=A0A0G2ESC8_PHACM|nr:putative white collar [Phaeomoniella chlamydospora]